MLEVIGRSREQKNLDEIWNSNEAELLALYGRRRVGKTFLVREHFINKKGVYLEITGIKDGNMHEQLTNFIDAFTAVFYPNLTLATPKNWRGAFKLLTNEIQKLPSSKKIVVFLDELPWLATKKSRLLQSLDYFWNTKWSHIPNVKLITCGSAASWMLTKLINAKGGLHNRITKTILLRPFSLQNTELFLKSRKIRLNQKQILDIYMIMGGIPFYLKQLKKSKSVAQNINDICFKPDGLLYKEFPKLFASLFDASELNLHITREIAKYRNGISLNNITTKIGKKSGGRLKTRLSELESAGFVRKYVPYGKKRRDQYYRIVDEYTLFYLKWIEPATISNSVSEADESYWQTTSKSASWQSWAGYSFEAVCYQHADSIRKALKINTIGCLIGSWKFIPKPGQAKQNGAQIDLLFDRSDDSITLCEIKYSNNKFTIDKAYAKTLVNKIECFEKHYQTTKQIFLTMITTAGIKQTIWSNELITNEVTLADLFK